MNYKTFPQTTKSNIIYIIMPKDIIMMTPEVRNNRYEKARNYKELVKYNDSHTKAMGTFYYELPKKGIALEEYLDYLVVNLGILAPEERFSKVVDIAIEKEKGLILKPPDNMNQLYVMDKIVLRYNELYGYKSIRF